MSQTTQKGAEPITDLLVSVIIPFLNANSELPELLEAFENQTLPRGTYEVILVDNGSTDGSLDWLSRNSPPWARVLLRHDRRSSYAARNLGIQSARAASLAFTDVDCRPAADWLSKGLETLRHLPRAAGRVDLVCTNDPTVAEFVDASRFLHQNRFVREGFGATANLFVRHEIFDVVGGFDERLISGGDYEFGQRATQAGYAIAYQKELIVRHPCRRSFRELAQKAHRVGFGFGQSLTLTKQCRRSVLSRVGNRIKLFLGHGLRERGITVQRRVTRAAIMAGILMLHTITVLSITHGLLAGLRLPRAISKSRVSPAVHEQSLIRHV